MKCTDCKHRRWAIVKLQEVREGERKDLCVSYCKASRAIPDDAIDPFVERDCSKFEPKLTDDSAPREKLKTTLREMITCSDYDILHDDRFEQYVDEIIEKAKSCPSPAKRG